MKTDDKEISITNADSKEEQENCDKPMEEEDIPNSNTNESNSQENEHEEDVSMNAEEAAENTD